MNENRRKRRDLLFLAAVLIAASAYYLFSAQGSPAVRFSAENRTVGFYGSKDTAAVFSIDALKELTLYDGDAPDYGTAVDGGETALGGYRYGTWKSESLGVYEAFVSTRVKPFVVVSDDEKTAIFNASDADTTRSFFEQLDAFRKGELPLQN